MGDLLTFPVREADGPAHDDEPFEVTSSDGNRATALDEGGALLAAYQLQEDWRTRGTGNVNRPLTPSVSIFYEGRHVMTIARPISHDEAR